MFLLNNDLEKIDELVTDMLSSCDNLGSDPNGVVVLDPERIEADAPWSFLERAGDFDDSEPPPEQATRLLGHYRSMRSPGEIFLYTNNLKNFFWGLVKHHWYPSGESIRKCDLIAGARLIALSTYYHERFHHFCDVMKVLRSDHSSNRNREEALAVAFEVRTIRDLRRQWSGSIGSRNLSHRLYEILMVESNRHTSPGYCEWEKYKEKKDFWTALVQYVPPPNHDFLHRSGVSVRGIMHGVLHSSGVGRCPVNRSPLI
ncbi:MAG: hypothetical protein FDZ69_00355 [Deltaproteobacteria bacterium]|nr:MAG: hypothetical protein FDZ69_00355 [Deltaproteobacteria bacterium]